MSRGQRIALLGAAVVVIVAAAVIIGTSGGGSSDTSSSSGPVTIHVKHEKAVGGVQHIDVKKGGQVRFTVDSDSAQEIHVHGYNVHKDVPQGGKVSFSFPAKIEGSFVVELEDPGVQIGALKVTP